MTVRIVTTLLCCWQSVAVGVAMKGDPAYATEEILIQLFRWWVLMPFMLGAMNLGFAYICM